jgi:predicted RNA-binding protein with RPS1 domain
VIARKSSGVCQPWHISKIEPHSCEQVGALEKHRKITAKYMSHIMQVAVEKDINVSVKMLQETAEDEIGFKFSYGKTRRAKEDIFQRLYGTYE